MGALAYENVRITKHFKAKMPPLVLATMLLLLEVVVFLILPPYCPANEANAWKALVMLAVLFFIVEIIYTNNKIIKFSADLGLEEGVKLE